MPCQPTKVHIVPHAHWDREWYQPFQGFRRRLVRTIDEALAILEGDPEYRHFWLDGQTIVLEDYLEIRPENEARLRALLAAGRLGVGPWYVQPDEALVSGEALIRNLLLGHRQAAAFGHPVPKIGYVPDIFGHVSQLPQILVGFGIDNAMLWRGLHGDGYPSELAWEGADGSHVLVAHFSDHWGYSDWFLAVRHRHLGEPVEPGSLVASVQDYLAYKAARATVPVILAMDGCDHVEPDARLTRWRALLQERFPGVQFIHSTLEEYLQRLRQVLSKPQMVCGELREPSKVKAGNWILNGVLSSRIHLKQRNAACQALLERWAEPAASLAALFAGQPYPRGYLRAAWRHLLQNHPHDSICGCSIDPVHRDMLYRFDQAEMIAGETAGEAVQALTAGIGVAEGTPGEQLLVLFNPAPAPVEGTVLVDLELVAEAAAPSRALSDPNRYFIYVYDAGGGPVPLQLCEVSLQEPRYTRPHRGVPISYNVDRFRVAMHVQVPACGYASYTYERRDEPRRALGSMATGPGVWEGRNLRLSVNPNGSVNLLDKATGVEYRHLLTWEDVGDVGDGWNHFPPVHDRRVTSASAAATVAAEYEGPLFTRLRLGWRLPVPASATADGLARADGVVELPITAWLDLPYDAREVACRVHVDNVARDHALRLLFPTGRSTGEFFTDQAFDLVRRPVHRPDVSTYNETTDEMVPQQSLVAVHDAEGGLCVLSKGLPAVNVRPDPARTIALSLLRGFAKTVMRQGEEGGQILGAHTFELALLPFRAGEGWEGRLCRRAAAFQAGFRTLLRPVEAGSRPRQASFLAIEPDGLQLSALKAAEEEEGLYVLRLYNPTEAPLEGQVRFLQPPREGWLAGLNEERGKSIALTAGGAIPVRAGPKKIVTFLLRW
jgi:alpha-mannosidase/mannosylglycerate hydrolase